jgi:hypothetical protein
MTPTEAAATFLSLQPVADAISSQLAAAKKVLQAHLAGRTSPFKGITTSAGGSHRLNNELVKAALGPKKVQECTAFVPSTSLVLPPHLRKGAVLLEHKLVPVGQADEAAAV